MDNHLSRESLEGALSVLRKIIADAVTSSSYRGEIKKDGQEAKNAAIRSSTPIQQLHGIIENAIYANLISHGLECQAWPPIGEKSPELKVTGLLKAKDQDISFTVDPHVQEIITTGVEAGKIDPIGFHATNRALVIGVRSQLSSIEKNFDTLVERAFAETLNLRLRAPNITLGEVYLIPKYEFDDVALKQNKIGFKRQPVNISKFTKIFNAITQLGRLDQKDIYKYDATMLIVADFSEEQVKVLWDEKEVRLAYGEEVAASMAPLLPETFINRITEAYLAALH